MQAKLPGHEKNDGTSAEFEKIVQPLNLDNIEQNSSPLHLTHSRFEVVENQLAGNQLAEHLQHQQSPGSPHEVLSPQELLKNDIRCISSSPEFSRKPLREKSEGYAEDITGAESHLTELMKTSHIEKSRPDRDRRVSFGLQPNTPQEGLTVEVSSMKKLETDKEQSQIQLGEIDGKFNFHSTSQVEKTEQFDHKTVTPTGTIKLAMAEAQNEMMHKQFLEELKREQLSPTNSNSSGRMKKIETDFSQVEKSQAEDSDFTAGKGEHKQMNDAARQVELRRENIEMGGQKQLSSPRRNSLSMLQNYETEEH